MIFVQQDLRQQQHPQHLLITTYPVRKLVPYIPDICHFVYTGKNLENKMYTEKRQFFALNL